MRWGRRVQLKLKFCGVYDESHSLFVLVFISLHPHTMRNRLKAAKKSLLQPPSNTNCNAQRHRILVFVIHKRLFLKISQFFFWKLVLHDRWVPSTRRRWRTQLLQLGEPVGRAVRIGNLSLICLVGYLKYNWPLYQSFSHMALCHRNMSNHLDNFSTSEFQCSGWLSLTLRLWGSNLLILGITRILAELKGSWVSSPQLL